jgi:hypothetical protein
LSVSAAKSPAVDPPALIAATGVGVAWAIPKFSVVSAARGTETGLVVVAV